MNEEPTEAQIKEFWEGILGDRVEFGKSVDGRLCVYLRTGWNKQDKEYNIEFLGYGTESIHLNNLFKYAVPKINFLRIERQHYPLSGDWLVTIQMYKYEIEIDDNDPALALFWAIYKALGGKQGGKA